jgi:hypothetical protein
MVCLFIFGRYLFGTAGGLSHEFHPLVGYKYKCKLCATPIMSSVATMLSLSVSLAFPVAIK